MTLPPTLSSLDDDHFHDECGVFGIYDHPDAAAHTALGLHALQHRGQESAGIAASDGRTLRNFTNVGLVSSAFRQEDLERLPGHLDEDLLQDRLPS